MASYLDIQRVFIYLLYVRKKPEDLEFEPLMPRFFRPKKQGAR